MNVAIAVALIITGIASQYGPGVAQRTIHVRQSQPTAYPLPARLPSVDGYIAMRDPELIGQIVYIFQGETRESFLVIDCAKEDNSDGTIYWMDSNNIIVEVDYETAVRWNTVGRGIRITLLIPDYNRIGEEHKWMN
jgi:hypothetical protein